jgi:precorrin-2/cobalt-factor-2 C20-methyltransferase
MTQDKALLEKTWDEALEVVVHWLALGQDMVFSVLGEPLLYGTFNYLLARLKKN